MAIYLNEIKSRSEREKQVQEELRVQKKLEDEKSERDRDDRESALNSEKVRLKTEARIWREIGKPLEQIVNGPSNKLNYEARIAGIEHGNGFPHRTEHCLYLSPGKLEERRTFDEPYQNTKKEIIPIKSVEDYVRVIEYYGIKKDDVQELKKKLKSI